VENLDDDAILQLLDLNHDGEIDMNEISTKLPPVKLNLTATEKRALVDFLKTLSDPSIFVDKRFSNPFRKKI
jgi:hypothetical protein